MAGLLALLLPWLRADPPAGLSFSNSPYTDEGLFNSAARDLVLFGSFGRQGLFRQLTNSSYVLVNSAVFAVTGPSLAAARVLSVLSVCAMVVVLLWGLTPLVGFPAALVAAACTGGSPIVLIYGHFGIVEPFETAMLVAGFVAVARGMAATRRLPAVAGGLLLAFAVGAKESALLALPGILGVPVVASVLTRQWRRLVVALSALAALTVAATVWALAVALPNRGDLAAATRTFGGTNTSVYLNDFGATIGHLWKWLAHPELTDHVLGWSVPQLAAVAAGLVGCGLLWRRVRPAHVYVTVSGLVWALGCWAVPVLSGYSPNRYLLVAVPGLALAAGPGLGLGLEWAGRHLGRPRWTAVGSVAVALLIFVPGVVAYLQMESGALGTNQLAADQVAVSRALPPNAVLFGLYGPDMAFSRKVRTVIPWPQSGLHMQAPVRRYGVDYVIADISGAAGGGDKQILRAVSPGRPLGPPVLTVPWGPHRLALYRVGGTAHPATPSGVTHPATPSGVPSGQ